MIPFPDIDTLEPTTDSWPATTSGFALDDRAAFAARMPVAAMPHAAVPGASIPAVGPGRSLFDDDFDLPPAPESPEEPEVIEPTFSLAEYEAAREDAYRAGQASERAVAETERHAADRATLVAITASLDATRTDAARITEDAAAAIGGLLLDTLATLFPALCARFGDAEAQAVIRAILPVLRQEPRATVRIAPKLVPSVIDTITRVDADLMVRIDIEPDPTLPAGDVRVTWRNGEARRDARAVWREIGDILGQAGWPVPSSPAADGAVETRTETRGDTGSDVRAAPTSSPTPARTRVPDAPVAKSASPITVKETADVE